MLWVSCAKVLEELGRLKAETYRMDIGNGILKSPLIETVPILKKIMYRSYKKNRSRF